MLREKFYSDWIQHRCKITVSAGTPADDKAAALQNDLLKALQKSGAKVTIAAGADGTSAANVAITVEGYDVASDGKVSKDGVDTGIKLTASAGNNNSTGTVALSDTLTLDSKAVTAAAKEHMQLSMTKMVIRFQRMH